MTSDDARTRRKRAPRFKEIAAAASVSEATVDRVLNERGSVSAPRIAAALRKVIDAGETVVTLVSQLPGIPGCHHTGIDNERAGRTAGYVIGRLLSSSVSASAPERARVLILSAHHDFPAHRQRVAGCIQALADTGAAHHAHHAEKATLDDPDICFRLVSDALKRGRVAAIYNTGEGSAGITSALQKRGASRTVVWVAHEMHDEHRVLLMDGTLDLVIDQDPDQQALSALQQLLYSAQQVSQAPPEPLGDFSLFMQPNVRMTPYLG